MTGGIQASARFEIRENRVSSSELNEKGKEKVLMKKHEIYGLTDKGRQLPELCGNLSEEDAKDSAKVLRRQLDALGTIFKEGSRLTCDFPDCARCHLVKMVEREFSG